MDEIVYRGLLKLGPNGEEDDILFLEGHYDPVVEELSEEIGNKFTTVRYYISDKEVTLEQAEEYFIRQLYGEVDADYHMSYSELTGYLWTTEELEIGGHDLLEELKSHIGKYLILIAQIDEEKEREKENKLKWNNAKSCINNLDYLAKQLGLTREELINQLDTMKK